MMFLPLVVCRFGAGFAGHGMVPDGMSLPAPRCRMMTADAYFPEDETNPIEQSCGYLA